MLAIYLFLLVFLLVLLILFTAIVLTFKLKVLSVEEKKELGGIFTVKWLLFSYTFSIKEPEEEKSIPEEPEPEEAESRKEDLLKSELKTQMEKDREPEEKKPEEETLIFEGKEKRGIFTRLKREKRAGQEAEVEAKKGMSTREKLHWGIEAYKALRKPLFRLFSDTLSAIKIKNLKADLTFGLSDPADTGMLCGLIHALLGTVYNRCRNCNFFVCPVFMETLLDFRGSAEIRIKIYSLIFPFLKFIFNGKTLSFTYSIVKEKLRGSSKVNS